MSRATPAKPLLYHHQIQTAPVAQLAPPDLAIKRPVTVYRLQKKSTLD